MSLLAKIQATKNLLKPTNTITTTIDGRKIGSDGSVISSGGTGFVIDTKPDRQPVEVIDRLLLGSQDCVDLEVLEEHKITHILSVGITVDIVLPKMIQTKFIECLDLPETNLTSILIEASQHIDTILAANQDNKILVHCNAGVSRSSSIVIGYLILSKKLNFNEAYGKVKEKRECIRPNDGFMRQLKSIR